MLIAAFPSHKPRLRPNLALKQNSLGAGCLQRLPSIMRCVSMEPARSRAAVPNFSGLTACQPRIIYAGRLSPHDLKKRLDGSVVTAENDLKVLREILERI
jgi:hypothetical protein